MLPVLTAVVNSVWARLKTVAVVQPGSVVGGAAIALERSAQDPSKVTLAVDGPDGRYAWGPGRGGSVTLGDELLTADVDVRLVGTRGDTVPLRAHFACRPRVAKKPGRR